MGSAPTANVESGSRDEARDGGHDGSSATPPLLAAAYELSGVSPTQTSVATWNGSSWTTLGGVFNGRMGAMEAFDPDGPGPSGQIIVAGEVFTTVGGIVVNHIAAWLGGAWVPLGSGLGGGFFVLNVGAMALFDDDGPGPIPPALVVGGGFTLAGGVTASCIAKYDGATWSALDSGMGFQDGAPSTGPFVRALLPVDLDGPGPGPTRLLVGGSSTKAGPITARGVAAWQGTWSRLGQAIDGPVETMLSFDPDGAGPASPLLCIGGNFSIPTDVGVAQRVVFLDGTQWIPAGGDPGGTPFASVTFDLDGNPATPDSLIVGGNFGVAVWTGSNWNPLPAGGPMPVRALASFDEDGPGPQPPQLFAGILGTGCQLVKKWNGATWVDVGTGLCGSAVDALVVFDEDGPGPQPPSLIAAGALTSPGTNIAKWNGIAWQALGGGLGTPSTTEIVRALAVFDQGPGSTPVLVAAGRFQTPFSNIAQWNGTSWAGVSGGLTLAPPANYMGAPLSAVEVLAMIDLDGAGPAPASLCAGGSFIANGATPMKNIASWNGVSWSPFGAGVSGGFTGQTVGTPTLANGRVAAIARLDPDADGPLPPGLYVGGDFGQAGAASSGRIARWGLQAGLTLNLGLDPGGSLVITHASCVPNASYVTFLSFDPLNGTAPGLGMFGGLHLSLAEALFEFLVGVPPFSGMLDASGNQGFFVPAEILAPLAGLTLYGVTVLDVSTTLFGLWETASPIASVGL